MKLLKINCCDECTDYRISYSYNVKGICNHELIKQRYVPDDGNDFPSWCPLPNAEEIIEKA